MLNPLEIYFVNIWYTTALLYFNKYEAYKNALINKSWRVWISNMLPCNFKSQCYEIQDFTSIDLFLKLESPAPIFLDI